MCPKNKKIYDLDKWRTRKFIVSDFERVSRYEQETHWPYQSISRCQKWTETPAGWFFMLYWTRVQKTLLSFFELLSISHGFNYFEFHVAISSSNWFNKKQGDISPVIYMSLLPIGIVFQLPFITVWKLRCCV
jgi:hypothetical protein